MLTTLATFAVAGGSKTGGSEGKIKEGGATGFARENEEVTSNGGKSINDDGKGIESEVRNFTNFSIHFQQAFSDKFRLEGVLRRVAKPTFK